jgi:general secretion pathway protein K
VPAYRPANRSRGERGFILIAAVWLLVLAGAITAVLMLRSLSLATSVAGQGEAYQRRLALEGAMETVLADRIFNGVRSRWWLTPSEGLVAVAGKQIRVRLSSESGRLDVNEADPAALDAVLRSFGIAPTPRVAIAARLQALRAKSRRVASFAALDAILEGVGAPKGTCPVEELTFSSALAQPRPDQMSESLARALGIPGGGVPSPPEPGAPMRIEAFQGRAGATAIVHLTADPLRPVLYSGWDEAPDCGVL